MFYQYVSVNNIAVSSELNRRVQLKVAERGMNPENLDWRDSFNSFIHFLVVQQLH